MTQSTNTINDWKETTLGEVAEILSGSTPSTKNSSYWDGSIPWITPKDLSSFDGVYISKGERNITEEGLKNSSAQLLPKNTLLFSSRAPIGYVAIAQDEVTTNQGFKNVVCDEDNSHFKFVFYWLKSRKSYVERLSSGSTFSEASATVMRDLDIVLPPLPEQKAIASVLSSFDDKIELLREQNKTLEETAQAIFRERFGKYKVGDILPEGWRVGKIGCFGNVVCGKTPSKNDKENFGGEIPFLKIPDMHNQLFILKTEDSLSAKGASSQAKKMIPKNSLCVSCIATVGLVSITTQETQTNQQINSVILNDNNTIFYLYFVVSSMKKKLLDIGSGGTTTLNINTGTFTNLEVIVPQQEILQKFDTLIQPMFDKISSNSKQTQTLSQLRDTLLPRLMRGEVRVKINN